jgi:predicted secreted protein
MSKVKGNSMLVYVEDVAIGCLNNNEFSSTTEEITTTCKDNDGAKQVEAGGDEWTISFDGTYETDSTQGLEELLAIKKNKTLVGVRMGVAGSGGLYIQGTARLLELSVSAPLNEVVTYSGSFTGNGPWSYGSHT